MKFGLSEKTIDLICSIFRQYPQIEKVIVYGSRAKGNYKNGSDIDLALIGGDDLTMDVLYKILHELDDLLLPYSFDISLYKFIHDPDLIDH
ncbi:MAG TPA: nucleotidyltransferase domain-containing protein, partial [Spirochaetota bacterium]|nr:nucleotidyltransferase domain-containing protein [Spirochaetota bacterium]HOM09116.1 nucleotidyltransferase domain-containing protein [Spirochaetota bacterium]